MSATVITWAGDHVRRRRAAASRRPGSAIESIRTSVIASPESTSLKPKSPSAEGVGRVLVQRDGGVGPVRRVVDREDVDRREVGVGERAAGAARAEVVRRELDEREAVVVEGRRVDEAVQPGVDIGQRAGEDHRGVGGAVAGRERQAGDAVQGHRSLGRRQADLHGARARIDVGHGDEVAVARRRSSPRHVLVERLAAGDCVHRRVVGDVGDRHRDGCGRALAVGVLDRVGERVRAAEAGGRGVHKVLPPPGATVPPWALSASKATIAVGWSPRTSFRSTSVVVTGVLSFVAAASAPASGASFTGATLIVARGRGGVGEAARVGGGELEAGRAVPVGGRDEVERQRVAGGGVVGGRRRRASSAPHRCKAGRWPAARARRKLAIEPVDVRAGECDRDLGVVLVAAGDDVVRDRRVVERERR